MDQHCQIAPLVIILTVCCVFSSNPFVSGDELMFVQAIWRHGGCFILTLTVRTNWNFKLEHPPERTKMTCIR